MKEETKPDWWPQNPYPETLFPMLRERYSEIVPDPKIRTALSGMLGREFWDIASKSIWDAMREEYRQLKDEREGHIDHIDQLQTELVDVRAALALMIGMILGGEKMSKEAHKIIHKALKGK